MGSCIKCPGLVHWGGAGRGGGMGSKKGETINHLEIGTVRFPKGDGPL